ncbi:MAG: ATP-binding protein [Gemmatimonadaceae bacterium]
MSSLPLGIVAVVILVAAVAVWFSRAQIREDREARARAASAWRASEAKFAGLLEISMDAIITVDVTQRILQFNRSAERIFGYVAAEVVGEPLGMLLPERYRGRHAGMVRQFAGAPAHAGQMADPCELFGLRRDGIEFPAEASISTLAMPDGSMVFAVLVRDITGRKAFEQSEARFAGAVAVLGETLELDPTERSVVQLPIPWLADGAFLDVLTPSGKLRRLAARTGDPRRDAALTAVARGPLDLDAPWPVVDVIRREREEHVPLVDDEWLEARAVDDAELARLRALALREVLFLPLIAREHVLGVLTLYREAGRLPFSAGERSIATELSVRAAFAIDNARLFTSARQATVARDHALGVVSHDLRNPISAIGMSARALLPTIPVDDSERRALLTNIVASQDLAQRMIRDLLDVASIETGHLSVEERPVAVVPLLDRALALFAPEAEGKGVALGLGDVPPLPQVWGDDERLVQVLSNLLSNAVKHTPSGGHITLSARILDYDVEVAVTDTGHGIPAASIPLIFERYWTVRGNAPKGGTGLGLAIARGIVEALGGKLWAESIEGAGSTFRFTLRIAD